MQPVARILAPVDFSERSPAAARYAVLLARHFQAELTLLHVIAPPEYAIGSPELSGVLLGDWTSVRLSEASRALDNFLTDELQGLKVHRVVIQGDPAHGITTFAHNEQMNLVVLPTHGYGPFRRFILGSTTAKVLHDADCPLLTGVHLEEATIGDPEPFRRILCAIDLGDHTQATLEWACFLKSQFGAALSVVHVVPLVDAGRTQFFDPDWRVVLIERAKEEVNRALKQAGIHDSETILETGDVARAVDSVASALKADLLIIGRGTDAGIFGRLRANSYAIIRESPCPVLSV